MSWKNFVEINKIGKKFENATLANCVLDKKIIDGGCSFIKKPTSLVLTGGTGRGKTYFSYCLMHYLVKTRGIASTRTINSKVLDDRILEDTRKYGSAAAFLEQLFEINFLFLDDFGIDRDSERLQRDYYEIIDRRWEHEKPTILSTNLDPKSIELEYGSRIFSRFKDYQWIIFDGPDLRGQNLNLT